MLFTSCGIFGSDDDSLTIRGMVAIPGNTDIINTEVLACFVDNTFDEEQCNYASPHTQRVYIEENGQSASYRIEDLAEGRYDVRALKDYSNNGWWDYREADCNLNGEGACDYFEPSVRDLDLNMRQVENDFRLYVTAPEGVELRGTTIVECFNGDCEHENSGWGLTTWEEEPGESYGVQSFDFTPGDYTVWAVKDVNGDNEWDFGGCYTGLFEEDCRLVQPGTFQVFTIDMESWTDETAARAKKFGITFPPGSNFPAESRNLLMRTPRVRQ